MVFSSEVFLFFFLPTALGLYAVAGRWRLLWLTGLSYLFYGWANPLFVLLMFASTLLDYLIGRWMVRGLPDAADGGLPTLPPGGPRTRQQRAALWSSVVLNLSLLGFFKYFNFAIDNYASVAEMTGLPGLDPSLVLRITLPLGISFYTFQSMSYALDIYRGAARPIRDFVAFACYVSMFPQLVAGPIIRFSEVATQIEYRTHTIEKFARGVAFFSLGLAKKVCFANPAGEVADLVFGASSLHMIDAWWGTLAYALQIYFDFSGYSDMAIGLGLMIGFVFPQNFDAPYRSASITEFWQRWHISLSTFLRDYLYVPLGGNRRGAVRTYINLALVMLLGGLWHGASWNFVIWGGIHGSLLGIERMMGERGIRLGLPRPVQIAFTFVLVCLAWVFFRAPTSRAALSHLEAMAGLSSVDGSADLVSSLAWSPWHVVAIVLGAGIVWGSPWQTWDYTRTLTPLRASVCLGALLLALLMLSTQSYNPFIYFIF